MKKAVVIFSGGQDSTTCLYWALKQFDVVHTITFRYGQKHEIEVAVAKKIANLAGVSNLIVDMNFLNLLSDSAMVHNGDVNMLNDKGLPASFVPNRNQLFVTLAHAYAQKLGAEHLVTGVCETDFSGYPDCRKTFIDALQVVTNLGSQADVHIHTPLMFLNKAQTFKLAEDLGCLGVVLSYSHTCYNGFTIYNEWGKGCGQCPACILRAKGYEKFIKEKNNFSAVG